MKQGTKSFTEALNAQKTKPIQWLIVATCFLVLVADGVDLQLLGVVAPVVTEAFDVTRSAFGIAMMAALVGFGIGGWGGGWLGDVIGRRWTLVIAALFFGFGTVAASTATDVWSMAFWRVIGGLGFGGAYANALAMAGEWLPDRWRPVAVSTLAVGTPIGGTIVGWVGPGLVAEHGWEGTFIRIGLATLVVIIPILLILRDSPSFLMALGRKEQAQKNARIVLDEDIDLVADSHETDTGDGPQIGVLHRTNTRLNIGIAVAFAASTLVAYGILSWGTTFLTAKNFSLEEGGRAVAIAGISSMVGSIIVGIVMRQFGSKIILLGLSLILFVWMLAIGFVLEGMTGTLDAATKTMVIWLVGLSGFAFSAVIAGMYVMMTHGYPQSCRSAGIGFGIFMSRVGAISAAGLGGALLDFGGDSTWPFFGVLAAAALLIAAAAFVVDRHVPPLKA